MTRSWRNEVTRTAPEYLEGLGEKKKKKPWKIYRSRWDPVRDSKRTPSGYLKNYFPFHSRYQESFDFWVLSSLRFVSELTRRRVFTVLPWKLRQHVTAQCWLTIPNYATSTLNKEETGSRGSFVGILTELRDGWLGVHIPAGTRSFSLKSPHRLWGPPSLLFNAYRGYFTGVKCGGAGSSGRAV